MPPPTLRALLDDEQLGIRLLTPPADTFPALRWVAFTELADPAPYLQGGEFVLTSGRALPAAGPELTAYVLRLARRRVAGLGFGIDRVHAAVPAALLAQAEAVGLPVFEVPAHTAFAAISRVVTELVAAAERDTVERPLQAQRRLLAAARRRVPFGAVVDEVAAAVQGDAVVVGPRGVLLHRTEDASDALVAAAADEVDRIRPQGSSASAGLTLQGRTVAIHPLSRHGTAEAYLAVRVGLDDAELGRSVVLTALTLLTLLAEQDAARRALRRRIRRQVADLVRAGDTTAAGAVAGSELLLDGSAEAEPSGSVTRVQVLVACDAPATALDDRDEGYVTSADGRLIAILAPAVVAATAEALAEGGARVGTSRIVRFGDGPGAIDQARHAVPAQPGVRTYDERMRADVVSLVDSDLLGAWAAELLRGVTGRATEEPELLDTLDAYLRHHGQLLPAAKDLGIHRHTMRSRITRIEDLLGVDCADPEQRANLVIAVRHRRAAVRA